MFAFNDRYYLNEHDFSASLILSSYPLCSMCGIKVFGGFEKHKHSQVHRENRFSVDQTSIDLSHSNVILWFVFFCYIILSWIIIEFDHRLVDLIGICWVFKRQICFEVRIKFNWKSMNWFNPICDKYINSYLNIESMIRTKY